MDDAALASRARAERDRFSELLGDLLEQVDQKRAAHLALDFARHVLDIERDGIAQPVRAVCLEYVEVCHEAIDLGEVPPRLPEVRDRLLEVAAQWDTNRHVLARGAGPILDAARVGTEQMLAKARGRARPLRSRASTLPANCRRRSVSGTRSIDRRAPMSGSSPVTPVGRKPVGRCCTSSGRNPIRTMTPGDHCAARVAPPRPTRSVRTRTTPPTTPLKWAPPSARPMV